MSDVHHHEVIAEEEPNGDGVGASGKTKPQNSPDSTVVSSGSKFSFSLKESANTLA